MGAVVVVLVVAAATASAAKGRSGGCTTMARTGCMSHFQRKRLCVFVGVWVGKVCERRPDASANGKHRVGWWRGGGEHGARKEA